MPERNVKQLRPNQESRSICQVISYILPLALVACTQLLGSVSPTHQKETKNDCR